MDQDYSLRILAHGIAVPNDTKKSGLNNNDMIIGASGSGKTRNYVTPNLLQLNGSVVVADTKGTLVHSIGPVLRDHGYIVIDLDFADPGSSKFGYNPLDAIRVDAETGCPSEHDIIRVANALCPIEGLRDPYWERSAQMYIACLIGYVIERYPLFMRTLYDVAHLAGGFGDKTTDKLLDAAVEMYPDSYAARLWRNFRFTRASEKIHASIIAVVAEKMHRFDTADIQRMSLLRHKPDFELIGERKVALFVTVSDTDRSLDGLVGVFYSQLIQALCEHADRDCDGALRVPTRLFLDDFATNCRIDNFDGIISVIRSRNICVSIMLQSISQLAAMYGTSRAGTILENCDHILFLGGSDLATADYVATRAGIRVSDVLDQPLDTCWLLERGRRAQKVRRFELELHKRYHELPEAQDAIDALLRSVESGNEPDGLS